MFKSILAALSALLATAALGAVDVNQASLAELEAVRGVGPAIAAAILDERRKGAFRDWVDLVARVKGIGAGSAARFSAAGLTVGGAPFKPAAAASGPDK